MRSEYWQELAGPWEVRSREWKRKGPSVPCEEKAGVCVCGGARGECGSCGYVGWKPIRQSLPVMIKTVDVIIGAVGPWRVQTGHQHTLPFPYALWFHIKQMKRFEECKLP